MFGYKLIIEKVWSDNPFLPKATIIMSNLGSLLYYPCHTKKSHGDYCYRLKLKFVKKELIAK